MVPGSQNIYFGQNVLGSALRDWSNTAISSCTIVPFCEEIQLKRSRFIAAETFGCGLARGTAGLVCSFCSCWAAE